MLSVDIQESLQVARNKEITKSSLATLYLILALILTVNCTGYWILCKENQINHMMIVHELDLLKQQLP